MPFLISTRAGFDDIVSRVDPAGAVFILHAGVASEAELSRLKDAGAAVQVLAPAGGDRSDPSNEASLARADGAPVWVERGSPGAPPAVAAGRAGHGTIAAAAARALHGRLAETARAYAAGALRRLRQSSEGRRLMLLPYLGFGNVGKLWIKGRVLDERGFREQSARDSRWSNLVAFYQRLESDQVAGEPVRAYFQGHAHDTVTDRGGYFSFEIVPATAVDGGWQRVELELPASAKHGGEPVRATAEVLVPAATARFGIISDIDDTVLWTNVTNRLNMALLLARENAHTRKPFKGVAAFYRALNRGVGGNEDNPMFYVSSSPWHLFGPLVEFLRVQAIPVGPLLLRELGVRELFRLSHHGNHKLDKIGQILGLYPDMQFVLIGDSGEQDPEIYAEVVRRYPQSVRMIYIRNVNPDPSRIEALDRLIEQVSTTGTQLILAPDSVSAASHAAAEGLIALDQLAPVRADRRQDA